MSVNAETPIQKKYILDRRKDGKTDNERRVETRGNSKSNGQPKIFGNSFKYPKTAIKPQNYNFPLIFMVSGKR